MTKRNTIRLFAAAGTVFAAALTVGFTDLPEEHWAYGAVSELVNDGTVGGFEDGSFRPNEPVTRAQLVKMVGYRTDGVRMDYISDIRRHHWAYDVLSHSPLRTVDGKILADDNATREQVAAYMYDCYGNNEASFAPSVITNQTSVCKNEVGWVYEHGIMQGDDGINLRLSDGLTRAEAAVLISNSRNKLDTTADFCDIVPESTLSAVFNNSGLFDKPYSPSETLTNGEAARAAYKLKIETVSSLYYEYEADFEHEYARDLKAMEPVLGSGRISAEFADAPAMPEYVLAMFAYAMASKISVPVSYGVTGEYYSDAQPESASLDAPLTFSYKNGIRPFYGGELRHGEAMTHKTIAAILLQYDALWGVQSSVEINRNGFTDNDEPMRFDNLPENAGDFMGILKNVPNSVYERPFETTSDAKPVGNYAFCNDLKDLFAQYLTGICGEFYEKYGDDCTITYYPQLVADNGNGFTIRVKIDGLTNSAELFGGALTDGSSVWADIATDYIFFGN